MVSICWALIASEEAYGCPRRISVLDGETPGYRDTSASELPAVGGWNRKDFGTAKGAAFVPLSVRMLSVKPRRSRRRCWRSKIVSSSS